MQALPASAETTFTPDVYISEINWAGSSQSRSDEWIELHNADGQSVDLSGWVITGSASKGEALSIAERTVLEAYGTLLIANYATDNEKTTLTVEADLVTASLSLSNSSQEILLAMPDGTVVDGVGDGGAPEAGSTEPFVSMQRNAADRTWSSATQSTGLSDTTQLGSPGAVSNASSVAVQPTDSATTVEAAADEVEELSESTVELSEEQLANCYSLYMPSNLHEDVLEPESEEQDDDFDQVMTDTSEDEAGDTTDQTSSSELTEESEELAEEPEESVTETQTGYEPGSVILNEIVSDPADGEEWVELFNHTNVEVDLTGWTIEEGSGKSTALESTILLPGNFLVVEKIKGNLNNGGDSVVLKDALGTVIDSLTYGYDPEAPAKGENLARMEDYNWYVTSTLTPGASNTVPELTQTGYENVQSDDQAADTDTDSQDEHENVSDAEQTSTGEDNVVSEQSDIHHIIAIADVPEDETQTDSSKSEASSSLSSVEGMVTAAPGTFGSQIAFIDGMQLYFYHADWPELQVGDVVRVTGESSTAWNEERVKIAGQEFIQITGSQSTEPTESSVADVFSHDIGSLMEVGGEILGIDGKVLTLGDDSGQIEIIANEKAGMSWSDLGASAYTVTGIVRTRGDVVQLYTRSWDDVTELVDETVEEQDAETFAGMTTTGDDSFPWIGAILMGGSASMIAYWFVIYKFNPGSYQST
ncbi:lamin tail domain-containing protein [Candidatus Uhrbacteria bacterium]|nr:lamin tail domain-containing protein [Candidatus Uhrbacteria bacterium]